MLNNRWQFNDKSAQIQPCKHVVTVLLGPIGLGREDVLQLDYRGPRHQ